MLKKTSFTPASAHKNAWWIALVCVLTLGASACGAVPTNALTPTPTTLMGVLPLNGQSTGIPTEIPTEISTEISTPIPPAGTAQPIDVCSLITQAEAETVLGQPVTQVRSAVDDTNTAFGVPYNFCIYRGTDLTVNLAVVDLGSAAAAGQEMQAALAKMMADTTSTTTPQTGGLGEQAYWTTSLHAATFIVLKGDYIFQVLLGGNIGDPAAYKTGLLNLAVKVAAKF